MLYTNLGYNQVQMDELLIGNGVNAYFPFLTKISTQGLNINQPGFQSVTVYPNPAEDVIILEGITEVTEGKIFNMMGQFVKSVRIVPFEVLEVSDLVSGMYWLKTEKYTPVKFIKK